MQGWKAGLIPSWSMDGLGSYQVGEAEGKGSEKDPSSAGVA